MRVSEVIKPEDVRQWKENDVITIKAGTGMGKSYFIKNRLYAHAIQEGKKILMLIHRSESVKQFKEELEQDGKSNHIDVMTYQKIDNIYQYKGTFDFSQYKYIVCDESQYFIEDASFNKTTDLSLNAILNNKETIKIFMSATGEYIERYIKNYRKIKTIDYKLDINYDFINNLYFFNKDKTMEEMAQRLINENKKAIIFIQSAEKAYKLHEKLKENTIFNCSKSNRDYAKYVDRSTIDEILKNERFEKNILITTTVMDSGINIIDNEIKNVIIDVEDINTLIQCMGRRRIDWNLENDGINVFVKNINNNKLGGKITQLYKKIEKAKYFKEHGATKYVDLYDRDPDRHGIVYDHMIKDGVHRLTKKLNELMYFKTLLDIVNTQDMIECGYMTYLSNLLEKEYVILEEVNDKINLEEYLDSVIGKKLYKKEQQELIEVFKNNGLKARTTGINTLNGNLKDREMPYTIISKKDNRRKLEDGTTNPNRGKMFWEVIQTEIF